MSYLDKIDRNRLPQHVSIIMDGNGRWATARGKDRSYGHSEGVVSVRRIVEAAIKVGIPYVTLYTFSTENWNRPKAEVDLLMHLIVSTIEDQKKDFIEGGVKLNVIGDLDKLPEAVRVRVLKFIDETSKGKNLTLTLAISYSSRWEIAQMVKKLASDVKNGNISIDDISEDVISNNLSTKGLPDPDLLIRTGGELRISNFLMWQISYSELYFTDVAWPDFRDEAFYEAIYSFQNRERRYGKTSEQVKRNEN